MDVFLFIFEYFQQIYQLLVTFGQKFGKISYLSKSPFLKSLDSSVIDYPY